MKADVLTHRNALLLILAAVLLRLVLMPFFMHMDLLSEYRRINYAFEHAVYYPGFNRLAVFYIESIFFAITQWLIINPDLVLYLPDPSHSTSSPTTHFIFAGDSHVYRHLFLFKLPYFVFDMLSAFLVWRYFKGHGWQTLALAAWLFNPVTLYATYFFGRFEVIPLFFLLWTVVNLKDQKYLWAALAFGLALNSREIILLFVPALLLTYIAAYYQRTINLRLALTSLAILLISIALPYLIEALFSVQAAFTKESNVLEVSKGTAAFFDSAIVLPLGAVQSSATISIYPFFLISAIAYFSVLRKLNHAEISNDHLFVLSCLSIILPFFMTGFNSAHYFSWAVPFLLLINFHDRTVAFACVCIVLFWFGFWLFNPHGAHFTPLLATPIHESLFGWGSFRSYYQHSIPHPAILSPTVVTNIFFSLCAACMIFVLYRSHQTDRST